MTADGHITIDTDFNNQGLVSEINNTNNQIRKTYKQLADESGKTIDEIKKDVDELAKKYHEQGVYLPQAYKQAYKEMGLAANSWEREADSAADNVADSNRKAASGLHSAWKTAFTGIGNVAKTGLKVAATAVTAMGAGLTAFGASAMKTGADFEAQMSKVQAIADADADAMVMLTEKAREMGRQTKFTATESGQALEYMAVAGWDAKEMADGLAGVMNLAAAAGTELGTTSDIVTDSIENFGLTAKDAEHYVNVVAQTMRKSNTDVLKLGESYKYVSPVAKSMGYSLEDVNVALGLMANSGIKASQAGTSLRTLLTNMAKPTSTMAGAMEDLGISLDDGKGNMKSFYEIMLDLRKGFGETKISEDEFTTTVNDLSTALENGDITQKQYDKSLQKLTKRAFGAEGALKANYAATIAGKEGMSGLLAIVNASDETFNQLVADLNNVDGEYGKLQYSINSLSEPTKKQAKALADLGVSVKDSEGNMLGYADALTNIRNGFGEMQMPVEDYNNRLNSLQGAYENGFISQKEFNTGVKDLMKNAYGAEGALKAQAAQALLGKDNLGTLAKTVGMTTEEFLAFTQEVENSKGVAGEMAEDMQDNLKGQIAIFGSALDDLKIEIYNNFSSGAADMVKVGQEYINHITAGLQENGPQGMIDALGDILQDIIKRAVEFLPTLVEFAIQLLGMMGTAIVENAPVIAQALIDTLNIVLEEIGESVPILQPVTDALQNFLNHLEEIQPYLEPIAAGFGILFAAMAVGETVSNTVTFINNLRDGLSKLWGVLSANPIVLVIGLIALLVAGFVTLWNKSEEFREFWIQLWNKIKDVADPIIKFIKEQMQKAWEKIKEIWGKASDFFKQTWEKIKEIWNDVKPYFEKIFKEVKEFIEPIWDGIKEIITDAWKNIKKMWDKAQPFFEKLFDAVREAVETVGPILKDIFQAAWKFIKTVWDAAEPFFSAIWEFIKSAVKVVKTVVVGAFKTAWAAIETVWNVVIDFFSGIFDAIKGVFKTIKSLWRGDFKGAKDAILGVFKTIGSTFVNIAKDIINGLVKGLKGGITTVVDAVKGVADGIISGFKNLLGIKSPSKVFKKFGNYIMDGLNQGIDEKKKKAKNNLEQMAKDVGEDVYKIFEDTTKELEELNEKHLSTMKQLKADYKKNLGELSVEYHKTIENLDAENKANLSKLHQDYVVNLVKLKEDENKAIQEAAASNRAALLQMYEDYKTTLENIDKQQQEYSNKILNFAGLLAAPQQETVITNEEVVKNAKAQTEKVQLYATALEKLRNMNLPEEILQQFIDMGAGSAEQLIEFSNMSASQLQQFLDAYQERKEISDKIAADNFNAARAEAERQYNEQKVQQEKFYTQQLAQISRDYNLQRKAADKEYAKLKKEEQARYRENLKIARQNYEQQRKEALDNYRKLAEAEDQAFREDMNKLSKTVEKKMEKIGNSIKDGLKKGTVLSRWEIHQIASNLTDEVLAQVRANLGIESPSKVFAEIGDYCIQGFEKPFKNYKATAIMTDAMEGQIKVDTAAIDALLNLNNVGKTLAEMRAATLTPIIYDNRETNTSSPTLNFYDTQTSPDAIYRKFNKTMRYGLARGV